MLEKVKFYGFDMDYTLAGNTLEQYTCHLHIGQSFKFPLVQVLEACQFNSIQ